MSNLMFNEEKIFEDCVKYAIEHYKASAESARLYALFRLDGYTGYTSAVMAGLRDPVGA